MFDMHLNAVAMTTIEANDRLCHRNQTLMIRGENVIAIDNGNNVGLITAPSTKREAIIVLGQRSESEEWPC